jgi:hypothetical protein
MLSFLKIPLLHVCLPAVSEKSNQCLLFKSCVVELFSSFPFLHFSQSTLKPHSQHVNDYNPLEDSEFDDDEDNHEQEEAEEHKGEEEEWDFDGDWEFEQEHGVHIGDNHLDIQTPLQPAATTGENFDKMFCASLLLQN